MPKRNWWAARAIIDQRRANRRGGLEYLVAWEGFDEEGTAWPDSWEPEIYCSQGLIDAYNSMLSLRAERKVTQVTVDIGPLLHKVRASVARAVSAAQEASFGGMHEVPVECLCLKEMAMAFLDLMSKPWAFDGSAKEREPLPVVTKNETHFVTYKDMEAIGEFCRFQDFLPGTGAVGALRYNTGRKSNRDAVVVGLPLRFAYMSHASGVGTFAVRFPTVRINGMYGISRGPHMVTGMLKEPEHLRSVVMYASEHLPRYHPLIQKGWPAAATGADWGLPDEVAVPVQ